MKHPYEEYQLNLTESDKNTLIIESEMIQGSSYDIYCVGVLTFLLLNDITADVDPESIKNKTA